MRRNHNFGDWGTMAVLILSLVTYIPWVVMLGFLISAIVKRFI